MLKVSIVKALLASQKEEVEFMNARDFALIVPSKVADKSKKVSYSRHCSLRPHAAMFRETSTGGRGGEW